MQNAVVAETPHVDLPYQASPYKSNNYSNSDINIDEIGAYNFMSRGGAKNQAEIDAFSGVENSSLEDPNKLFFNHIYDKKYDKYLKQYDRNYRKWHKK